MWAIRVIERAVFPVDSSDGCRIGRITMTSNVDNALTSSAVADSTTVAEMEAALFEALLAEMPLSAYDPTWLDDDA
jgi:hypothetical protein